MFNSNSSDQENLHLKKIVDFALLKSCGITDYIYSPANKNLSFFVDDPDLAEQLDKEGTYVLDEHMKVEVDVIEIPDFIESVKKARIAAYPDDQLSQTFVQDFTQDEFEEDDMENREELTSTETSKINIKDTP